MTTIQIQTSGDSPEQLEWVNTLTNMYYNWCKNNGCSAFVSKRGGKEAEIQTDARISPLDESGLFRLVRVSPYDPEQRRHTVFARVIVDGVSDYDTEPRRSFVLDPYQMATDHKTGTTYDNPLDILSGNIIAQLI